jgi:argininosuccinate synthase
VENRLVGIKSRGVYETPGGTSLYHAHEALESICLDKTTQHFKQTVAQKYADLVYDGMWYTQLREAMDAFVDSTQQTVTGEVKLKLYKGNVTNVSITSPYSLHDLAIASFGESDYDHADAGGFINLFGLQMKMRAKMLQKHGK